MDFQSRGTFDPLIFSFSTPEHITSVDIHPIENYIAAGDSLGKITFWYFLNKTKPLTSTVHWHANRVNCLRFTQDGVYLLSGGHEGVLVIWQLETRAKNFLPHLGSEIRNISISADQLSYLLHLRENSLKIVSAVDLQVKNVLNGTKTTNTDKNYPFSTGIVLDPRSRSAVMNGYPGTIQFYDVMNDSHVLDLEITPRNRISSSEDFDIVVPHITKVSFSQNGNWMATIDKKVDSVFGIERNLHFWKFDHENQKYVAHTRIESPHDQDITSIDFRPSKDGNMLLVTSGLDKKFKIWELAKASTMNGEESWTCLYSSSYKDMVANCAKFSPDGSILCVCFGKMITLWDPLTLTLEKVLYYSVLKGGDLKHVSFSNNYTHLIVGSKTHLYVWNLLSCSVEWCLPFKALRIVSESGSDRFLALSKQSQVLIFSVTSPIPVFYQDLNANNCSIVDATFINNNTKGTILLLTSNHQFDIIMESPPIENQQNPAQILKSTSSRLFTDIFGDSINRVSKDEKAVLPIHSAEKDLTFLSSPSFMTPPPVKLVKIFLESFLSPQVQLTNEYLDQNVALIDPGLIETPLVLKDDNSKGYHNMDEVPQGSLEEVNLDRMDALTELFKSSKISSSTMVQGKKKSKKSKK
jgi:NET1-associated nuclear protein 1 (U3 small nucleolar RNA-associated protein 17)